MLHLEGQRRRPGNWLLVTLIFISSLRSEAVEIPSSMDGTLTPEAHAQIYSNPTCLELMKHNRWRSWARRQNVDLRYAPSLCYGKEAYDELLEAASHWEKGGLLNDYLVKIRLMPGGHAPCNAETEVNMQRSNGRKEMKNQRQKKPFKHFSKTAKSSLNH
eukprot:761161-Hanusia_phi.AAC.6